MVSFTLQLLYFSRQSTWYPSRGTHHVVPIRWQVGRVDDPVLFCEEEISTVPTENRNLQLFS